MQKNLKTITGLSIANIVVIVVVVALAIWVGLATKPYVEGIIENTNTRVKFLAFCSSDPNFAKMTIEQIIALITRVTWICVAVLVVFCWIMIVGTAIIIARATHNPRKIGNCIIWAIIGIVLSFLTAQIISLILWIIITILIIKTKKIIEENKKKSEDSSQNLDDNKNKANTKKGDKEDKEEAENSVQKESTTSKNPQHSKAKHATVETDEKESDEDAHNEKESDDDELNESESANIKSEDLDAEEGTDREVDTNLSAEAEDLDNKTEISKNAKHANTGDASDNESENVPPVSQKDRKAYLRYRKANKNKTK